MNLKLRSGNFVKVRTVEEILNTLNKDGTLDGLQFMPEMLKFCGKNFRVSNHVVQAVIDGAGLSDFKESYVRNFKNNDVVFLEDLRCSGLHYGGCQRGCILFWKEAWLMKIDPPKHSYIINNRNNEKIIKSKTIDESGKYFCQSTQFSHATKNLSQPQRIVNLFLNIWYGNYKLTKLIEIIAIWSYWKVRKKLFGEYPKGTIKNTPVESLNLQSGEFVQVKSLNEIIKTLDRIGRNHGLHFTADMIKFCNKVFKVRSRADKLIKEATGEMRSIPDTVILDNVFCDSAYYAFGGCPREDFAYWREIWLKRV